MLAGIALAGGRAYLPLTSPPSGRSTHVLRVHTPDCAEPLVLLADPIGAPTADGFLLRVRMCDPQDFAEAPDESWDSGRSETPITVSHSRELRPRVTIRRSAVAAPRTPDLRAELLAAAPEALIGRTIASGTVTIVEILGQGSIGWVYRAWHAGLGIHVAVKVLQPDYRTDLNFCRQFHSEALAASRLDHPNLTRVLDFGQEPDGLLYLAMEHLHGEALSSTITAGVPLALGRIVVIMTQVCSGLAHAHARGIVHRDIKPSNVVLVRNTEDDERPEELVKVCDFGIASRNVDGESSGIAGTPHYMSPEQCRGEPLDGRSDIYACGVMLYELATGQMPFEGANPAEIMHAQVYTEPLRPSMFAKVHPRLELAIMKALEKDPARRHASMRDLRQGLRALLALESPQPTFSTAPPPPTSQRRPATPASERETLPEQRQPEPSQPEPSQPEPSQPEWIERKVVLANLNLGALHLAAELADRPASWLASLASAKEEHAFAALANRLEAALPELMSKRDFRALLAVRRTLDHLASEEGRAPAWRIDRARALQRPYGDPTFLAAIAEAALVDDQPGREIGELLSRSGTPAMYALYSARLRLHEIAGIRNRFVLLVRELGTSTLPMIRAGLGRLEAHRHAPIAAALAFDLFAASPRVRDDDLAEVAGRYLQDSPPDLTRIAAEALVPFAGARAAPLLGELLESDDDAVRLAGVQGLRELDAVDELAVRRMVWVMQNTTSREVRAAVMRALDETAGAASVLARRALARLAEPEG
jgi:serine/threonine-protein kinase